MMSKKVIIGLMMVSIMILATIFGVLIVVPTTSKAQTVSQGELSGYESNLAVLYHFNENNNYTAETCVDSATSYDGIYQNGTYYNPFFVPSPFHTAFYCDGSALSKNYITIPSDKYISLTRTNRLTTASISFWIKIPSDISGTHYIMEKQNSYRIYMSGTTLYAYFYFTDGSDTTTKSFSFSMYDYLDKWTMITYIIDRDSSTITVYRNNVKIRTSTITSGYYLVSNSNPLYIGCRYDLSYEFYGAIDELAIYFNGYIDFHQITDFYIYPSQTPIYTNQSIIFNIFSYNWFNEPRGTVKVIIEEYNFTSFTYNKIYEFTYLADNNEIYVFSYYFINDTKYRITAMLLDVPEINSSYEFLAVTSTTNIIGTIIAPSMIYENISYLATLIVENTEYPYIGVNFYIYHGNTLLYSQMKHLEERNTFTSMANFMFILPYNASLNYYTLKFELYNITNSSDILMVWTKDILVRHNPIYTPPTLSLLLHLKKGWNLISLPIKDEITSSLLFNLNDNITAIMVYENGTATIIHRNLSNLMSVTLNGMRGIYIYLKNDTTLVYHTQRVIDRYYSIPVVKGWNLISVPYNYDDYVSNFCKNNPHIKLVTIRDEDGQYHTYINGFSDDLGFRIKTGQGIFIYSESDSEVIWQ